MGDYLNFVQTSLMAKFYFGYFIKLDSIKYIEKNTINFIEYTERIFS
jgi:hypothetical protein